MKINGELKCDMKNVFNLRVSNCQFQYLIHWHGYDMNEHTWEPFKHLSNAMEKVKNFMGDIQTSPRPLFFLKFIVNRGGDVINTNIKHDHMMNGVHSHGFHP
jgi:hypothetical protein